MNPIQMRTGSPWCCFKATCTDHQIVFTSSANELQAASICKLSAGLTVLGSISKNTNMKANSKLPFRTGCTCMHRRSTRWRRALCRATRPDDLCHTKSKKEAPLHMLSAGLTTQARDWASEMLFDQLGRTTFGPSFGSQNLSLYMTPQADGSRARPFFLSSRPCNLSRTNSELATRC